MQGLRKNRIGRARPRFGGTVVVAAALCAVLAPAPARAVVSQPQPREAATMVADPATGKLVLFGGLIREPNTVGIVNDTWVWSGTAWKRLSPPTSPRPRFDAAMSADPATGTVVLFGGDVVLSSQTTQGTTFNDTWTWNGRAKTWTEQVPVLSPPVRRAAAMAPDPVSGTVVLFGGTAGTGRDVLGDTWTWDGTAKTWTLETPAVSPPPRSDATMVYDKTRRQLVLFGGQADDGSRLNDTWTWNGAAGAWTQPTPPISPPGRYQASMAYDAFRKRVVLFGGDDGVKRPVPSRPDQGYFLVNDTWTWDGSTWTQQAPLTPPEPRTNAAMAYHPGMQKVVLFSGIASQWFNPDEAFADTWTYGAEWKRRL